MRIFTLFLLPLVAGILIISSASAEEIESQSTSVPEPSVAVLGGICGLLFLIWRRK